MATMDNESVEMDPRIWSRLPQEILMTIVYYGNRDYDFTTWNDRDDLWKKWIDTVRGDPFWHRTVLSQHFDFATVSWRDLVLDPSETQESLDIEFDSSTIQQYRNLVNQLQPNSTTGYLLGRLLKYDNGLCPANVVSDLRLNFDMGSMAHREYLAPSHATVRYSMGLLLPKVRHIKKLRITSAASGGIFEVMSDNRYPRLQLLQVGLDGYNQSFSPVKAQESFNMYDWGKLTTITGLTELYVGEIKEAECNSLCAFVSRQRSLRQLYLEPRRPMIEAALKDNISPFQKLLGSGRSSEYHVLACDLLAVLPASLEDFRVADQFFLGNKRFKIPPPEESDIDAATSSKLSRIELAIEDMASVPNLLARFPGAAITSLAFSPVQPSDYASSNAAADGPIDTLNEIVSKYAQSLQEIVLSNAWKVDQALAEDFNQKWDRKFEITNITLFTECPSTAECPEEHGEHHEQDLTHLLFGCSRNVYRWGSHLQRIRLELSGATHQINYCAEDLLQYPSLQHLRILSIALRDTCSATPKAFERHQDIADTIVRKAPKSLRYIRICGFIYWVDVEKSGCTTAEDSESAVCSNGWTRTAKRFHHFDKPRTDIDNRLHKEYKSWERPGDWDFIDEGSRWNIARHGYTQRILPGSLTQYWLQSFNFMVATRVSTDMG